MNIGAAKASTNQIVKAILILRGQRVPIDFALARMYGVETGALIQAVKRNRDRFPADFMFQLVESGWTSLRSQTVMSKPGRGRRRFFSLCVHRARRCDAVGVKEQTRNRRQRRNHARNG